MPRCKSPSLLDPRFQDDTFPPFLHQPRESAELIDLTETDTTQNNPVEGDAQLITVQRITEDDDDEVNVVDDDEEVNVVDDDITVILEIQKKRPTRSTLLPVPIRETTPVTKSTSVARDGASQNHSQSKEVRPNVDRDSRRDLEVAEKNTSRGHFNAPATREEVRIPSSIQQGKERISLLSLSPRENELDRSRSDQRNYDGNQRIQTGNDIPNDRPSPTGENQRNRTISNERNTEGVRSVRSNTHTEGQRLSRDAEVNLNASSSGSPGENRPTGQSSSLQSRPSSDINQRLFSLAIGEVHTNCETPVNRRFSTNSKETHRSRSLERRDVNQRGYRGNGSESQGKSWDHHNLKGRNRVRPKPYSKNHIYCHPNRDNPRTDFSHRRENSGRGRGNTRCFPPLRQDSKHNQKEERDNQYKNPSLLHLESSKPGNSENYSPKSPDTQRSRSRSPIINRPSTSAPASTSVSFSRPPKPEKSSSSRTPVSRNEQDELIEQLLNLMQTCPMCPKKFPNREEGRKHLKKAHDHIFCDVCFKPFKEMGYDHKKHFIQTHVNSSGERAPCPICGDLFKINGMYHHLSKMHFRKKESQNEAAESIRRPVEVNPKPPTGNNVSNSFGHSNKGKESPTKIFPSANHKTLGRKSAQPVQTGHQMPTSRHTPPSHLHTSWSGSKTNSTGVLPRPDDEEYNLAHAPRTLKNFKIPKKK